jgi:hypothetical protein
MNNQDLLLQAKQRLSLPVLMSQLGFGDRAKKSARCPFHDDSSASFSVFTGDDGQDFWKCHAGCGQGDAIDFLAKHRGLNNADACREYIRLADVSAPPLSPSSSNPTPSAQPLFYWQACVAGLTPEHRATLGEWRGYSPEFVSWLHAQNLVGLFDGDRIAFPVHNAQGHVIGCHYRRKEDGSWRYQPTGTRTAPLIIGDLATAKTVLIFESQWDLLAVLDCLHHHVQPMADTAAVATRGAGNGRLLVGLCAPDALVYAFGQNDDAGQKWLAAVAANSGRKTFQAITPPPYKDANDWTRAGATADEIRCAIADAQLVAISTPTELYDASAINVSMPAVVLPDEPDEPEAAPFPLDALTPIMAGITADVAKCERVTIALAAICVLGVGSAAIGAGMEVESAPDRYTRANLFILGSAESGSGKSQVFRRIAEPILEHQHNLIESFEKTTGPQLASEIGLLTQEIKRLGAKAAKESIAPADRERLLGVIQYKTARLTELKQAAMSPCVIVGDVTSEKLAVLLAGNHETLYSGSPEARQIVDVVCGRYNATQNTDEAVYLSSYSGDFLRVDRLGREPITLRHPCLSVTWLLQPDVLVRLFQTASLSHSGFLPRFLTCQTQAITQKIAPENSPAVSYVNAGQWTGLITGLLGTYHVAEQPYRIKPTPEAKLLLDAFFNAIVDRRATDLVDLGPFASRYGEQAWRVALTLHAGLHGVLAHKEQLTVETAKNAIRIVEWFIDEQLNILSKSRRDRQVQVEDEVFELLKKNQSRRRIDYITARDIHRARITPTADAARALLDRMERDGLLVGENITPEHGGKTTRIFRAVKNPIPV